MKQRLSRQPKTLSEISECNGVLEISRRSSGSTYGLGVTGGNAIHLAHKIHIHKLIPLKLV